MTIKISLIRSVLALALTVLISTQLWAQDIQFDHVGLEDGLSQVSVRAITQDKYGVMWLGTRNGLNRYDGRQITTFEIGLENNQIIDNQIQGLAAGDSLVYIATPNAISTFNLEKETFSNFPQEGITAFHLGQDHLWVATGSTLYILNTKTGTYTKQKTNLPLNESIRSITSTKGNDLYLGTDQGLWKQDGHETILMTKNPYQVMSLFVDSKDQLWVGTYYNGLLKFKDDKLIHQYKSNEISNNFVRCVEEDDEGKIWVGTFSGLDAIWPDGKIIHYENIKSNSTSISHNSIWSLFKDKDGSIWAGTYFGGVNIFHPTKNIFIFYPEDTKENRSINYRVVGQVTEDPEGNLYICTDGGGLNYYNRKTGLFTYFTSSNEEHSIKGDNMKSLFWQGDTVLWVGTHRSGLNAFDVKTGKFKNYLIEFDNQNFVTEIYSITKYQDDLLLGTGVGCLIFDTRTKKFKPFLPAEFSQQISSPVISILNNDDFEFWIGTEKSGLFKYDINKQTLNKYRRNFENQAYLQSDQVNSLYKDKEQKIWVGTSNGLALYLPESDNFKIYGTKDGLSGNAVYGILDSRFSGLSIQTNKGISFFDKANQEFNSITYNNGLMLRELSPNGLYLASDGTFSSVAKMV